MGRSTFPPDAADSPGAGDGGHRIESPHPAPAPTASTASTEYLAQETYRELRKIAARCMRGQRSDHTLQPTALVHEAFIRLARSGSGWASRGEFVAVAGELQALFSDGEHIVNLAPGIRFQPTPRVFLDAAVLVNLATSLEYIYDAGLVLAVRIGGN